MAPIVGSEGDRQRAVRAEANATHGPLTFINPYPWMSGTEARVYIELEAHSIPFSWRWFDGYSPTYTQLLANRGYQPEFTLREYNAVILVVGGFFGTLPGAVDLLSLATVTLQADGWKVITLFEQDILTHTVWDLLIKEMPSIGSITGAQRPNPYGHPTLLTSFAKKHYRTLTQKLKSFRVRSDISGEDPHARTRTIHRLGRRIGDSGRTRSERVGAVSGRRHKR
ncbi:MAG: hypothetical protein ACXVGB_00365 [Mycobacteriaceae bacterium]